MKMEILIELKHSIMKKLILLIEKKQHVLIMMVNHTFMKCWQEESTLKMVMILMIMQ